MMMAVSFIAPMPEQQPLDYTYRPMTDRPLDLMAQGQPPEAAALAKR